MTATEDCEHVWIWDFGPHGIWGNDSWQECIFCGRYREDASTDQAR